ncbi:MAG: YjbQ family protein [Candidatus Nealsonbacteria bacterium]|nr:YjbQ family protein [Candidatus Nealsonbacteria bacterium]
MKILNKVIQLNTKEEFEFIDLTKAVEAFLAETGIQNGFLNIQTMHTTAPLVLNENEPLLLDDFKNHLAQLSPKDLPYRHNDFTIRTVNICQDECKNGHSHCLALHFPSNLTLNIMDGKLQMGQWQRIFLVELDKPRQRQVQIQIIGEE